MNDFGKYCRNRIKYNFYKWIFFGIIAILIYAISGAMTTGYVYALETETIYATNSNCTLSNNNKYNNIASNGTITQNSINTTYNGKSYGMQFSFAEDMLNTKVYSLKITFMADDLLTRVNENFITIRTFDTTCDVEYATILSIEKNTTSGNATWLTINFIPNIVSNKGTIIIGSEIQPTQITGETTFGIKKVEIGEGNAQDFENVIINQNQNTENLINNQNQNTQNLIDSQQSCNTYNNGSIVTNGYLWSTGNIDGASSTVNGITDYININGATIQFLQNDNIGFYSCFYKEDKTLISCFQTNSVALNTDINIPNNAHYIRVSINRGSDRPQFKVCKNGNQAITDAVEEQTKTSKGILGKIGDLINYINPASDSFFLKLAFIPTQEDMQSLLADLKTWFEGKFGVLGQGITIMIDILDKYNDLDDSGDVIIHIPNISVPNFENTNINIIEERDFNWSELLRSKQQLIDLWMLYLDFIDIYLWFAFLNYCLDVFDEILEQRRIQGDDIYENEGESYNVNSRTGEISNKRVWKSKSTRSKK